MSPLPSPPQPSLCSGQWCSLSHELIMCAVLPRLTNKPRSVLGAGSDGQNLKTTNQLGCDWNLSEDPLKGHVNPGSWAEPSMRGMCWQAWGGNFNRKTDGSIREAQQMGANRRPGRPTEVRGTRVGSKTHEKVHNSKEGSSACQGDLGPLFWGLVGEAGPGRRMQVLRKARFKYKNHREIPLVPKSNILTTAGVWSQLSTWILASPLAGRMIISTWLYLIGLHFLICIPTS